MSAFDKPRFYYYDRGSSYNLNPDGDSHKSERLLADYSLRLGILSDGESASLRLVLYKPKLDERGIKIKKNHRIEAIIAGSYKPFIGIIDEISIDESGTYLTVSARSYDYALDIDAPDLVSNLSRKYVDIGLDGEVRIDGRYHIIAIVERSGEIISTLQGKDPDSGLYTIDEPDSGFKFSDMVEYASVSPGDALGTLIFHESAIGRISPTGAIRIPLTWGHASEGQDDPGDDDKFTVSIWSGCGENYPVLKLTSKEVKYKDLKAITDSTATTKNSHVSISPPDMFSNAPYFVFIENSGDYKVIGVNAVCLENPRVMVGENCSQGLLYDAPLSAQSDPYYWDGFGIYWNRPPSRRLEFSSYYDEDSSETVINVKLGDLGDSDIIKAVILRNDINEFSTRETFKRSLWAVPRWPFLNSFTKYMSETTGPELKVRALLGSVPSGKTFDNVSRICRLEGWIWLPSGFDPAGYIDGNSNNKYNTGYPSFYDIDKIPSRSISDEDILDLAIIDHDRPDPETLIKATVPGIGEVRLPVFYEDFSEDSALEIYPFLRDSSLSSESIEETTSALLRLIEMDKEGGSAIIRGHRPELLASETTLRGSSYFVRALELLPDMTTKLILSSNLSNVRRILYEMTSDIKTVEAIEGDIVSLATYGEVGKDFDEEYNGAPRYEFKGRLAHGTTYSTALGPPYFRRIGNLEHRDGSKVAYFLFTFSTGFPLRWPRFNGRPWSGVDKTDPIHIQAFRGENDKIFYYTSITGIRLSIWDNKNSSWSGYNFKLPHYPRLWPKRRFNIVLVVRYG